MATGLILVNFAAHPSSFFNVFFSGSLNYWKSWKKLLQMCWIRLSEQHEEKQHGNFTKAIKKFLTGEFPVTWSCFIPLNFDLFETSSKNDDWIRQKYPRWGFPTSREGWIIISTIWKLYAYARKRNRLWKIN